MDRVAMTSLHRNHFSKSLQQCYGLSIFSMSITKMRKQKIRDLKCLIRAELRWQSSVHDKTDQTVKHCTSVRGECVILGKACPKRPSFYKVHPDSAIICSVSCYRLLFLALKNSYCLYSPFLLSESFLVCREHWSFHFCSAPTPRPSKDLTLS